MKKYSIAKLDFAELQKQLTDIELTEIIADCLKSNDKAFAYEEEQIAMMYEESIEEYLDGKSISNRACHLNEELFYSLKEEIK